ncbi:bifunctional methylenetetrahydrofolate dehydrogenase/methenyltetrahydrofolate cyclohydrolase [Lactobacillus intestinalis]|uniref:bifunctional methylenetetrahydrofolate dehydrogenase/methenyltetrahydrofolate cyclohydrolase n=2 Tax=Lactobacillus intestinalis TaxID=151781 RepID=UPI0002C9100D|nr:bifunctional methylenetetrahydrofolate dehydrogenase/methenyltetrahydrofolate cyclohydrolase [Lactobacillus intestinalis]KAI4315644.1 Bifunctional protein FolD protein [Lactobacillus intestinalis]
MTNIIDGRKIAKELNAKTKKRVEKLNAQGITPGIVVILIGDNPASIIYTRNKHRTAEKLGMKSILRKFPKDVSQTEVLQAIHHYNDDPTIHAILIQLPLPKHLNQTELIEAIAPEKDVDGFNSRNVGKLYNNEDGHYPVSCTSRGIMTLLHSYLDKIEGKNVTIVGRSILVSRPLQSLLINENATVTMVSLHTDNIDYYTKHADILVVAAGKPNLIKKDQVKPGATVIDVGINRTANHHLVGDVDFDDVKEVAENITPVPGGVGPMTIATLMQQTVDLCEWNR